MRGDVELVRRKILEGYDVNALSRDGSTPLFVSLPYISISKVVIEHGVNVTNNEGKTVLDYALEYNLTEIVDILREPGGKTSEELLREGK